MEYNRHHLAKQVTFLIVSCDKFSDCWKGFFYGLRKYWPDCPFSLVLLSNFKEVDEVGVRTIKVGEDKDWSSNLIKALKQIKTPYLLLIPEDAWLTRRVNTSAILDYVKLLDEDEADYIRLHPCPPPDEAFLGDARLGRLGELAAYRTSTQMPLWRISVLKQLLRPGENAWQFEINGTYRSRRFPSRFLCVKVLNYIGRVPQYEGIDYINSAVVKGKWSRMAIKYSLKENPLLDFSTRPIESYWEEFIRTKRLGQFIERFLYGLCNPRKVLRRVYLITIKNKELCH